MHAAWPVGSARGGSTPARDRILPRAATAFHFRRAIRSMASLSLPDLTRRVRRPEIMDGPGLDPAEPAAALRGLGRINAFSRSGQALWRVIGRLAGDGERPGTPLRVLDVATGGGDVPIRLA